MTDDDNGSKIQRRVGRPPDTAEPSPAASELSAAAIRDSGRTQKWVASKLDVSERSLRRWLDGSPSSRGPTLEQAKAFAQLLGKPELVDLWWPPENPIAPTPAPPHVPEEKKSTARNRRTLVIVAGALAAVLAVIIGIAVARDDKAEPPVAPTAVPLATASPAGSEPVKGKVNGEYAGNRVPAKTIGLWTKPGMSSGCDLASCPAGTRQAGRVSVGQTIAVSCVTDGQMLRNGSSGDPGYYEDLRWLRLVPGQQVEQTGDDDLYLSNIWFLRDKLPPLAACSAR